MAADDMVIVVNVKLTNIAHMTSIIIHKNVDQLINDFIEKVFKIFTTCTQSLLPVPLGLLNLYGEISIVVVKCP